MQLKSILNRVERYKSFVYGKPQWVEKAARLTIVVPVRSRANSRPICSGCGRKGPGYDRLPPRRFEFVPLWQIAVFFVYAMRRVDCPRCGVTVEQVPWAEGKCTLTTSFRWFLARWAKRLCWQEVADAFWVTWEDVFRSVKQAVSWGLAHRDLSSIEAIGVDEIQWHRGHHYLTLVYQIDEGMKRLLWIAENRTEQSLRGFFQILSEKVRLSIRFVCSDMCQAYLNVIAEQLSKAVHVLDRFHIMKKMNEAIDEVRRDESALIEAGRLRAGVDELTMVPVETPGEPDRQTNRQAGGVAPVQSPERAKLFAAGGFSAVSGNTPARPGRESSWTNGVPGHCGPGSNQ